MTDREVVEKILEVGVKAFQQNPEKFAVHQSDSDLSLLGNAAIAGWLEELGKLRLVGEVQPTFDGGTMGFAFRLTREAVDLYADKKLLNERLSSLFQQPLPQYDLFISYATEDFEIAEELRSRLANAGLKCFMAAKNINAARKWEEDIHAALVSSKRILLLITPRSKDKPWILLETGAAWGLKKELIPALMFVEPKDLIDPIRHYQGRKIETSGQKDSLIADLTAI